MSDIPPALVLRDKTRKTLKWRGKGSNKFRETPSFVSFFSIMGLFDTNLSRVIDSPLGMKSPHQHTSPPRTSVAMGGDNSSVESLFDVP